MDSSCGPLLVPAPGLELSDHPSIEVVRSVMGPARAVLQSCRAFGGVGGNPGGHRGPADTQFLGHWGLLDPADQVAFDLA